MNKKSPLVASQAEVRALDESTIAALGMPAEALMEVAGFGCFLLAREDLTVPGRVVFACGPGQNGGDGFVIARYCVTAGLEVEVFAMREPRPSTPAAVQLERLLACGIEIDTSFTRFDRAARGAPLLVDALFGTGLRFPLVEPALAWIAAARGSAAVFSVDLPSGLDGDLGNAPSGCVSASRTLTIGAIKPGLLTEEGARHAGRIDLVPLPYPPRLTRGLKRL